MDIPPEYISIKNYKATLGHKINHSFDPNCRWDIIEHPVFGRIPRIVTIKDIKADEELTCHYMIDMEEAGESENFQWYIRQWEKESEIKW